MKNTLSVALSAVALSLPLLAISEDKHVHGEAELYIAIEGDSVLLELASPADNILGFEHQPSTPEQKRLLNDRVATLSQYTSLMAFEGAACKQLSVDIDSPFTEEHEDHHDDHDKHSGHGDHHDDHAKHSDHDDHHDDHDKHSDHEDHHDDHDKHSGHDDHHDEHDKHSDHDDHHDDHKGHDHGGHYEEGHSGFAVAYKLSCENATSINKADVTAFDSFAGFQKVQVYWVVEGQNSLQGTKVTSPKDSSVIIK